MHNVRLVLRLILIPIVGLFLYYVMPQQDVARIVDTESRLTPVSGAQSLFFAQEETGSGEVNTRDLRLISTERRATYLFGLIRGGRQTMVYRNEDTGWIYPPYFKFDSADLQAEAAGSVSLSEPYNWVVVTHYGWRMRWLSVYPNAVAIRPIELAQGQPIEDYRIVPWVNMIIFAILIGGLLFLRAMWIQFRERMFSR